jgi:XTP/dITP diphosphohydrolase
VLVVATRNAHKLAEIRAVLADLDVHVHGASTFPGCPDVVEDRDTLEGNAEKKAREVAAFTGLLTLADDTGLEVAALDGQPGVFSARWAGEGCTFADNNRKLLRLMESVPDPERTAVFRCVLALAEPAGALRGGPTPPVGTPPDRQPHAGIQLFEGRIEGRIARAPSGSGGFGYDPVFLIPSEGCTMADLSPERKNQISHRARALHAMRQALERRLRAPDRRV